MNTTLTVDKAGRVVLPKPVRDELQLAAGDSLELESSEDRIVLPPVTMAAVTAVSNAEGRSSGPMLVDASGHRLNRHQAARIVQRVARAAGVPTRLRPPRPDRAQTQPDAERATGPLGTREWTAALDHAAEGGVPQQDRLA